MRNDILKTDIVNREPIPGQQALYLAEESEMTPAMRVAGYFIHTIDSTWVALGLKWCPSSAMTPSVP